MGGRGGCWTAPENFAAIKLKPTAAWGLLRARRYGWKFKRQQAIGSYIVDFVCLECRVIVEADGSQHAGSEHDKRRDTWLRSQGFTVVRFWNEEILDHIDGVEARLAAVLAANAPSPSQR